jgi:hypothetical protein
MIFKKQEKRTIIVGFLVFLLVRFLTGWEIDCLNSVAALMASLAVVIVNFNSKFSWNKMMVIIPTVVVMTSDFIFKTDSPADDSFVLAVLILLVVWVLKAVSFSRMESYTEKCFPDQPNLERMKKSFYEGTGIVLAVMLLSSLF